MIRNYFKTAWRNLVSSKVYSLLNIAGLATGLSVALLIGLWVKYQYSYDRIPGYKSVYKAGMRFKDNGVILITAYPLAEAIKQDIPGVEYVTHTDWIKSHGLVAGETKIYLPGAMAGSDFLKIFKYPLLKGSANTVLKEPNSIVLTASTARSLFGEKDPINQIVRIDNINDLKVTGVLRDIPENSTLQFNYLVPFEYLIQNDEGARRATTNWDQVTFHTYVSLKPHVSYTQIAPALKKLMARYNPEAYAKSGTEIMLHPMKDWHLYADFKDGVAGGFIEYLKMFGIIGFLVLVIACINFINLSTARSEKRAKEVGIRKVVGSRRHNLIFQFLVESVIITFIAFVLSLVLVQLALPAFNQLTGSVIEIPFGSVGFWSIMASYVLLTGLASGSRPAFYLSSFNPIKVLKGTFQSRKTALLPRKILVVLQFTCSVTLMISTLIIYRQIQYAKNRPMGFDTNRVIMTNASIDLKRNYTALKNDLLQSGLVSSVTQSSIPVTDYKNFNEISEWQGKLPGENMGVAVVGVGDPDYFKTIGLELAEGRHFLGADDTVNVILNQTAVKLMRLKTPLNQLIAWDDGTQRARIVGVANDALMGSPYSTQQPALFNYAPAWSNYVIYKLAPNANVHDAVAGLTPIFNKYNPSSPYIYDFADEAYATKFKLEELVGTLSGLFAALAILISCLGLFSLAAYMAERRTKEIGIRKVLGASVSAVWLLLSKDFIVLVVLSCIIASPIAFFFLQNWLEKYNYRIGIGPMVFIEAGLGAVLITLVTISFQAIKAALMNPVRSIRIE